MTQTTASHSAVLPSEVLPSEVLPSKVLSSNSAADTYSNDLMDDLFSDVDQILGGDLSNYMTVVGRKPTPIRATRAVPTRVGPSVGDRSYALNVRATTSIPRTPRRTTASSNGFGGGHPVTSPRRTAAQSGNFHSAVIQASGQSVSSRSADGMYGTPDDSIQSVSNTLYPKTAQLQDAQQHRDFTFASPRPPQTIFEPEAPKQVSLPFLLMGAASISAVSTAGLWAISQNAPSTGWLLSLNREASAAELTGNSTEDFLAYLQRSLDVISARQASQGQTMAVIPVANRTSSLPTTVPNTNPAPQSSVLPNLPGAPAAVAAPSVIERVFVPVYGNNQAATQETVAAAVPSVAVPQTNAQLPKVPVPAPVAAAAAIPPGAPAAATPSVPVVPVGATALPTPTPPAAIAISPANAAAAMTDTTPTSEHVLVGVLNLGSRSAALFNIEGTSQRAYVGDRIGVSDWTLVSVNGQDVQVRRNGEVRSIYIGQRF